MGYCIALSNLGVYLAKCGDPDGGLNLLLRADSILSRNHDPDTMHHAQILENIGMALCGKQQLLEGLVQLKRCEVILRRELPPSHPKIAAILLRIADAYHNSGRFDECAKADAAALAVERRSQVQCAGPSCTRKLREDGAPLDVCVKCRATFYCGKACQTADWKAGHRAECKALMAEASGVGTGAGLASTPSPPAEGRGETCGAAGCSRVTTAVGEPLTVCLGCGAAAYCSVGCQRTDWRARHKTECGVYVA